MKMKDQMEQRLRALKTEYESGEKTLTTLESRQSNIQRTLLRISGAIQVLEEILSHSADSDTEDAPDEAPMHSDACESGEPRWEKPEVEAA